MSEILATLTPTVGAGSPAMTTERIGDLFDSYHHRLYGLARRLSSARRPAEAAELLEITSALSPKGTVLREEAKRLREEEGLEDFDREFKRRNLEASHALGMASAAQSTDPSRGHPWEIPGLPSTA